MTVDSFTIAGVVFGCTFGGAMAGIWLRGFLPETHLSNDSKDVVKMGTGLIATLAALVLGLLVASAKSSFDAQRTGLQTLATNLILLDRSLKFYGPEATPARDHLRRTVTLVLEHRWPPAGTLATGFGTADVSASGTALFESIRDLTPRTETQKTIQAQAMSISFDLAKTRWLLTQAQDSSIPTPFLVILIFWLSVLFVSFGIFSPRNATVIICLFICALSVAGAIFLIIELDQPLHGVIQISSKPLRDALAQFGQ